VANLIDDTSYTTAFDTIALIALVALVLPLVTRSPAARLSVALEQD